LTQRALGIRLGVSHQQIQKYELGETRIAPVHVKMACKALRTTPNTLFGWKSLQDDLSPDALRQLLYDYIVDLDAEELRRATLEWLATSFARAKPRRPRKTTRQ
jgi:transcriptional regulator with XRE-family HTH domain